MTATTGRLILKHACNLRCSVSFPCIAVRWQSALRQRHHTSAVFTLQKQWFHYIAQGKRHLLPDKRSMATSSAHPEIVPQDFDYFLVLDFEATCEDNKRIDPQEIIEFPVLKVSGKTFETEATFHQYVEPQVHGVNAFCTELTGITPEMVKGQPTLEQTLQSFHSWMNNEKLLEPETRSIFVTCGDWDLKTMLPGQCSYLHLAMRPYFGQWINIKKAFAAVTGQFPRGMMPMLSKLKIPHEGRHHSGIDDCRNIANILRALARRKYKFHATGHKK